MTPLPPFDDRWITGATLRLRPDTEGYAGTLTLGPDLAPIYFRRGVKMPDGAMVLEAQHASDVEFEAAFVAPTKVTA